MLQKMCRSLGARVPEHLAAVREALQDHDASRLREAAHKFCGMLSAFSTVAAITRPIWKTPRPAHSLTKLSQSLHNSKRSPGNCWSGWRACRSRTCATKQSELMMSEEQTTVAVQRYLDALAEDAPAEPIVRALLDRSVRRLQVLCANLLYRALPTSDATPGEPAAR